jgi:hypothetical protein
MKQTQCQINKAFGEKLLFAKTKEQTTELTNQQENHYLVCDNPVCIENMANLIKYGLFKMNDEQQADYKAKQEALELEEESQIYKEEAN